MSGVVLSPAAEESDHSAQPELRSDHRAVFDIHDSESPMVGLGILPQFLMRTLSGVITVTQPSHHTLGSASMSKRVWGSRLLVSLFAVDAFSWATGKIFQYEVMIMAGNKELGWCYVVVSLVLTASETGVEWIASAVTPRLFTLFQDGPMTSKQLVHFGLKMYMLSNVLALLLYPWFGYLVYVKGVLNSNVVYALAFVRTCQYAFGNQVGDTAVEMSKPHWMMTFEGVQLNFPGSCTRLQCSRTASPKSVALYIALMKHVTYCILAIGYTAVKSDKRLRWYFASALLVWNAFAPFILLREFAQIAQGIGEEKVEADDKASASSFCSLRWCELSFLTFVVSVKGIPPQAAEALQSIMVLELDETTQGIMLLSGVIAILSALVWKIHEIPTGAESGLLTAAARSEVSALEPSNTSFCRDWLLPVVAMAAILTAAAFCIVTGDRWLLRMAVFTWVPIEPIEQIRCAAIDTFFLRYDQRRSSNVAYWGGVLKVLINAPVLAINWAAIERVGCDDETGAEIIASGVLLYVASALLLLLCLYYATVDRYCVSTAASLRNMVESVSNSQTLSSSSE